MLHWRQGIYPLTRKVILEESQEWINELFNTIALPITFFLAFGLGLRGYIHTINGVSYMHFVAPGLITMTVLFEAYRAGAWGFWLDLQHQGMMDEYRTKPITTSDIILGMMTGGFVTAIVKGTIVALILVWLAQLPIVWSHIALYLLYLLPGCIIFTCIGAWVGAWFRKPDHIAQVQAILITPLLYLGGLFFPIASLPSWLIPIVHWIPTTVLFESARNTFLQGQWSVEAWGLLVAWSILSFFGSLVPINQKLVE